MNPFQMALQIREELRTIAWPTGSADVVFGTHRVAVFVGTPTEEQIPPGFPWCLVGLSNGDPDEDAPELIEQQFALVTGVEVAGDPLGEFAMIGGSVAELGKSAGRGLLEIEERVRAAVQDLTGEDGAKIILSASSYGPPTLLGRQLHLAWSEITLTALCTSALHYAAPQVLARSGTTWTWEGTHVSDRFDFRRYTLGYVAGATPVETIAELDTVVYQDTAATTTHTVVASQAYSVFAEYNARGAASTEGESDGREVGAFLTT